MVSVLLIANPASGKYKQSKIDRILSLLKKKSDNVEVALPRLQAANNVQPV